MAHLHFKRTVYKSGGRKASERLAYITRTEGQNRSASERQLHYISEGREDLVAEGTRNLPAWAAGDPQRYFQAAEQYEGGGPQRAYIAFEEWKITLPQELDAAHNRMLVDDLLDMIVGDHMPCTWAFHNPATMDGTQQQPHLHLLLSTRCTDGHVRSAETHFKRYNQKHPERGGAQKDPTLGKFGAVKASRLMMTDVINVHLEAAGQGARIHPESLARRGIARAPEPKLLPSESQAYRTRGVVSPAMQQVLDIRQERAAQPPREQNNARQYWETRKQFLGVTRDMTPAQQLAQILLKRHGSIARVPARYRRVLEQFRERLPALVQQPQSQMSRQARTRTTAPTPTRTTDVLRRLQQLRQQGDEVATGKRLKVHLTDDREQGMSW